MGLKRIILPIVLLLAGLNAADAVIHDTNDPNLVGYWKLDETSGTIAVDSKGGDNNGTIVKTNSAVNWGAAGVFGTGVTFGFSEPNADGRIVVPLTGMRKEAGTVALWAKLASYQGHATSTFRYFMGWQGSMNPTFQTGRVQIYLYPAHLDPEARPNSLSVGLGDQNRLDSHIKELNVNEWYHIALTWQATSLDGYNGNYKLYVDGIDMPSGTMVSGYTPGTYKNIRTMADYGHIGNHRKVSPGPEDVGFIGTIDEVGFYNAAISREKILGLAGIEPNLPFKAKFVIVNKRRVGRTVFEYECKVALTNLSSFSIRVLQFELQSVPANMMVIDANVADFEDVVGTNETKTSGDTCKFTVDRSEPINAAQVTWKVTYEVINSGQAMQQMSSSILALGSQDVGAADITGDGVVDFNDLGKLAGQWLRVPGIPSADIAPPPDGDGTVDFQDFAELANHWLE